MSRAGGYVRFPEGTIKAFIYDGTTDTVWPALFDTSREAWDAYSSTKGDHFERWSQIFEPTPIGNEEDVEVYSDYGGGFWWHATATRNAITSRFFWDDFYEDCHDGAPEWLRAT